VTPSPRATSFITSRPVAILMLFLAAVVFGYLSYGRLPLTLMPELSYPTLTVRTEYPGAAPEEVENDISRPIEEELGVIPGLRKINSISRAGISDVVLEFAWDSDMSDGTQDVLEKLDLVFLPDEAKRPLILHYDPSLDPVMELSLSGGGKRFEGERGLRRLRRLADLQIKKELDPVKGVAAVRVRGGLEEEIHVRLEEEALRRSGVSIQQVIDRLAQENINVAGGTLKEGRTEYLVRTLNEYTDVGQIGETIVASFKGRDVRIRDLGEVAYSHKEREILTRTDGGESVQIDIYKEGDANIVALAHRVRTMLGEFDPDAWEQEPEETADDEQQAGAAGPRSPPQEPGLVSQVYREEGAKLALVADRSLFIESSVKEVRNTAVLGGLLAILVLFLFLRNALSTAIIAVSIPISLLITFAPLNLLGVTLNIMSLGGLALGIGMLVDSSIVVLESIYRCREEGDGVEAAANRGTSEVRAAVMASTLTSIAVFFPMVFVEGIAGQAFGDLGIAVVVSLLASAAVALFFIPMLASKARLGLSVVVVVAVVLGIVQAPQMVKQVFLALVGLLLVSGFVHSLVLAIRGRLQTDPYATRMMGLGRWVALGRIRESIGAPIGHFRWMVVPSRRERSFLRKLGRLTVSVVLFLPACLVAAVEWVYYVVIRFVLGSLFEWAIGKPLVMAFVGAASIAMRALVPALRRVLGALVWLPIRLTGRLMDSLGRAYPRIIRAALAYPAIVVLAVGACFWITWQAVRGLESELLPEVHQGEFTVEVALPVGTPIEETEEIVAPIEGAILAEREQIESLILTVGYDSANSQRSDEGEHSAKFKVLLDERNRGAAQEEAVIARLRRNIDSVPDLDARIVRPVLFSSKTPIEVEVHGHDLRQLKEFGDRAQAAMAALPELADVETTLRSGAPEVQIVYDRDRLARYDLNIRQVAQQVRNKVQGFEATRFNMTDRRVPIVVRLAMNDRETVQDIREIIINPGGERPIRLAAVADVTLGEGPSEVRRIDARRVAVVRANIDESSLSSATAAIERTLRSEIDWPAEMTFLITGQNEEWQRSQKSLWIALALSVFLVYVIMAAQFESLIHPLVIMLTIPLAFFGTVITLQALGMALSIVVFLGMIMLAGIVVNNAIVLVDYINRLRQRGLPRDEAIVKAGSVRLRPILMTTATTVLGLTPMALGLGDGAEIRTPMAIAVISGLISSTALTLIVIPSFYQIADRLKQRLLGGETVSVESGGRVSPADASAVAP
jgi:HAE1 family hydrophobic/amphiphilic exporter-1